MTESARGDIVIVITADSDDVDRRLEQLEERLGRVNDQIDRQTQSYQKQNRSLAASRRHQQRIAQSQSLHLRRLSALNTRYHQFNSSLQDSSNKLDTYDRNLNKTADSLERVRDLSGDIPTVGGGADVGTGTTSRATRISESERERLHATALRNREALERTAEVAT